MFSADVKLNYYAVLGVPLSASSKEIKKAYGRLAIIHHPDHGGWGENMKIINIAYGVLSDKQKRKEYDKTCEGLYGYMPNLKPIGNLKPGTWPSQEFRSKIEKWKRERPSSSKYSREYQPVRKTERKPVRWNPVLDARTKMSNRVKYQTKEGIYGLIPLEIWNWRHNVFTDLKKEVFDDPCWSAPIEEVKKQEFIIEKPVLPQVLVNIDYCPSSYAEINELTKNLKALKKTYDDHEEFEPADISGIQDAFLEQWKTSPWFVKSTPNLKLWKFVSLGRGKLRSELGYIPSHLVKSENLPTKMRADACHDCENPFTFWKWASNCAGCGASDCSNCLTYFKLPEYEDSAGFCVDCQLRVLSRYKKDFIKELDHKLNRRKITPKYLQLLDEMGWVKRSKFLELAKIFVEDGRGDLAVQCVFSGFGHWVSIARLLVEKGDYKNALKVMGLSNQNWERIGKSEVNKNIPFVFLCFLKAGVDFKKMAFELRDSNLGRMCLLMLDDSTDYAAIGKEFYDWGIFSLYAFCRRLEVFSFKDWINHINKEKNLQCAEHLVAELDSLFEPDWNTVELHKTKDHIRWRFLKIRKDFNSMFALLKKTTVKGLPTPDALACFDKMFPNINYDEEYKKCLAKGDLLGTAICYLFKSSSRSWPIWIIALRQGNGAYKNPRVLNDPLPSILAIPMAALIYQKSTRQQWIAYMNKTQPDNIPYFLQGFVETFGGSINSIRLNPDRSHFLWPYLKNNTFDILLNRLTLSIRNGNTAGVGIFRAMTRSTQYCVRRDDYIKAGKYLEAAICHRLMMDPIPWEDLAKKMVSKNQEAAVFFYCLAGVDLFKLGNVFAKERNITMAARCYIQSRNRERLPELKKFVPRNLHSTLSVIHLHHRGDPNTILHTLCKELIADGCNLENVVTFAFNSGAISFNSGAISDLTGLYWFRVEGIIRLQVAYDLTPSLIEKIGILDLVQYPSLGVRYAEWFRNAKQNVLNQIKQKVRQSLYKPTFSELSQLMELASSLTHEALFEHANALLEEFKAHHQLKSRLLIWRSALHLLNPEKAMMGEALDDLSRSLFSFSDDDSISAAGVIVEFIDKHCKTQLKDYLESDFDIGEALPSEYANRLQGSSSKRMSVLTEKAASKMSSFEAAMVYYDKIDQYSDGSAITGNILRVAYELLKSLEAEKGRRTKHAYRRGIVKLITNAYMVSHRHLCPPTRIYVARMGIAILRAAFQQCRNMSEFEEELLEMLSGEVKQQSDIAPLLTSSALGVYDFVYMNLIYRRFLSPFLRKRRLSPYPAKFQYTLFEGTWDGWANDKFSFQGERYFAMKRLLGEKGQITGQVEELMHWPVINRDSDGWVLKERTPLNLGEQCFSRVVGVKFDLKTGGISFILDAPADPMEALFSWGDLQDIFEKGIIGSIFTLDPPDPDMPYHPFQEMNFYPKSMAGTNHLGTLLHADILLKEFSMQTEVSGKTPFPLRDASKTLLRRLPHYLRRKFKEIKDEVPRTTGRVHRFWIEAGNLEYAEKKTDTEIIFEFGNCSMSVKKHMMRRDASGDLVDTEEDNETDSPEAKFAKLMTDHYEQISQSYPELIRLKELTKLQAIAKFALSVASTRVTVDKRQIRQNLQNEKSRLSYDQCNSYRVAEELAEALKKAHGISRNITSDVQSWLVYGGEHQEGQVVSIIKAAIEAPENEKYLRIERTMKRIGFPFDKEEDQAASYCRWVPAAFRRGSGVRAYGGVNLQAKLVSRGGPPNGGGPIGGSGGSGPGARYVVRLDQNGRIHGTMTGVDRVTGNTYDILKTRGCVQDQWNQNHPRATGVQYFWQSRYGGDVHHYTRHTSPGGSHVHYTNGTTSCTTQSGRQRTYGPGEHPRRCDS